MKNKALLHIGYAFLCGLVAFIICLLLVDYRPFTDEGSVCTISQGIVSGLHPYTDFFNEKTPLQYYLTAFFMLIFGKGFFIVRLVPALMLFLLVFLGTLHILKNTGSRFKGLAWVLVLLPSVLTMQAFNNTAETTLAVLFPVALWLFGFYSEKEPAKGRALIAGILFGIAIGFKQHFVLTAIILPLLPLAKNRRINYVLGFFIGIILWVLPLLILGVFKEFFEASFLFHLSNPYRDSYLRMPYLSDLPGIIIFVCALVYPFLRTGDKRKNIEIAVLALFSCAGFVLREDAFRLLPAFTMLLAYDFAIWAKNEKPYKDLAVVLLILIALWAMINPSHGWQSLKYHKELAVFIESHSAADDYIWVAPHDATLYCLSERKPASKYYFILPWVAKPEVKERLLSDLKQNRPKIIVQRSFKGDKNFIELNEIIPEINRFLSDNYQPAFNDETTAIYLLKTSVEK